MKKPDKRKENRIKIVKDNLIKDYQWCKNVINAKKNIEGIETQIKKMKAAMFEDKIQIENAITRRHPVKEGETEGKLMTKQELENNIRAFNNAIGNMSIQLFQEKEKMVNLLTVAAHKGERNLKEKLPEIEKNIERYEKNTERKYRELTT